MNLFMLRGGITYLFGELHDFMGRLVEGCGEKGIPNFIKKSKGTDSVSQKCIGSSHSINQMVSIISMQEQAQSFRLTNPRTEEYYELNHWTGSVRAYTVQYKYKSVTICFVLMRLGIQSIWDILGQL